MTEESTSQPDPIVITAGNDRFRKITERSAKEERRGKLFRRVVRAAFLLSVATAAGGMWFHDRFPILFWPALISVLLLIPLLPLAVFSGAFIPGQIRFLMNARDRRGDRE